MNQITQESLEEFAAVIRDLSDTAARIAQVEEAKAAAASQRRHELLDGYIQDEQAQILKLRGLEQRRLTLADALGWKSLTFRQILEKAAPEQDHLLRPLFSDLEQNLKRLEHARKSSEKIINAISPYAKADAGLIVLVLRHLADEVEKGNPGAKELYEGMKKCVNAPSLTEIEKVRKANRY